MLLTCAAAAAAAAANGWRRRYYVILYSFRICCVCWASTVCVARVCVYLLYLCLGHNKFIRPFNFSGLRECKPLTTFHIYGCRAPYFCWFIVPHSIMSIFWWLVVWWWWFGVLVQEMKRKRDRARDKQTHGVPLFPKMSSSHCVACSRKRRTNAAKNTLLWARHG